MLLSIVSVTARLFGTFREERTSTMFPGSRNPATPTTSSTRTVTARMFSLTNAARVLPAACARNRSVTRISPRDIAVVDTLPITSSMDPKNPSGVSPSGMLTSLRCRSSTLVANGIDIAAATTCAKLPSAPWSGIKRATTHSFATKAAPTAMSRDKKISSIPLRFAMILGS